MKRLVKEILFICCRDKSEELEDPSDVFCNIKAMVVGLLIFEVIQLQSERKAYFHKSV